MVVRSTVLLRVLLLHRLLLDAHLPLASGTHGTHQASAVQLLLNLSRSSGCSGWDDDDGSAGCISAAVVRSETGSSAILLHIMNHER